MIVPQRWSSRVAFLVVLVLASPWAGRGRAEEAAAPEVAAAIAALKDGDAEARSLALATVNEFGPGAKAAAPALVDFLKGGDADLRASAARSIGAIKVLDPQDYEPTIRGLVGLLKDREGPARAAAIGALAVVAGDQTMTIRVRLSLVNPADSRLKVRGNLGDFGRLAEPALPEILAMLKGEDREARDSAAAVLLAMIPGAGSVVPALVEVAGGDDKEARETATGLLSLAGWAGLNGMAGVAPDCTEMLKSRDRDVRLTGLALLAERGRKVPDDAAPALIAALRSGDEGERETALAGLAMLGPEAAKQATSAILDLYAGGNEEEAQRASTALRMMHDSNPDVADSAYLDVLRDRRLPGLARMEAAGSLCELGPKSRERALPVLAAMFRREDYRQVRERLVRAVAALPPGLQRLGDRCHLDGLLLTDRQIAAMSLGACGPGGVDLLVTALKDGDPAVRLAAILGLEMAGPAAKSSGPAIRELIERDPNPRVRERAKDALDRVSEPADRAGQEARR